MASDAALQGQMEQALAGWALGFAARVEMFKIDLACALRAAIPTQRCPRCNAEMSAIKGSTFAVCRVCGYKDDCC